MPSPTPAPPIPGTASPTTGFDIALQRWAERAAGLGWLAGERAERLATPVDASAADLFDTDERPLTVGLFGGTGVGKSSLLNRIAGQPIARASAERPTSRGVSAYLHRSRTLDALPADFPLERLHTAVHHEERWRDVLWIDMPDVDSVAIEHRAQVVQWLPHLDVVVYVASPERYRDDRGWQLLVEHAAEHAWLFVMNQWDRGDARQLDDWREQLDAAGFPDPVLYRCVAGEAVGSVEDDFPAMLDTLASLADRRLIGELERRGTLARLERLTTLAATLRHETLGAPGRPGRQGPQGLPEHWRSRWPDIAAGLSGALEPRLPELAARSREAGDGSLSGPVTPALFDEGTRAAWRAAVQRFAQEATAQGLLPRGVSRRYLPPACDTVLEQLEERADAAIGPALARPGTALQRRLHAALAVTTTVLPLAALGWAGWRVLDAFRRGGSDPTAYLDGGFAITATLLVALAWALPWWLAQRVRPSRPAALQRGLRAAVDDGLASLDGAVSEALQAIEKERGLLSTALDARLDEVAERVLPVRAGHAGRDQSALPPVLARLLSSRGAGAPGSSGPDGVTQVRATTHSDTEAAPVS